jgi:hypothetical protein
MQVKVWTPTKKPLDINQIFHLLRFGKTEFGFELSRHAGYVTVSDIDEDCILAVASKSDEEQSIPFMLRSEWGFYETLDDSELFVVCRNPTFRNNIDRKMYGAFELG